MAGYVAKTTNTITGHYFVHSAIGDPGSKRNIRRIGTGKLWKQHYNQYDRTVFVREILYVGDDHQTFCSQYITENNLLSDPLSLNVRTARPRASGKHPVQPEDRKRPGKQPPMPQWRRDLISAGNKGRKWTEEHKRNQAAARVGLKRSEETRAKMRAAHARRREQLNGSN